MSAVGITCKRTMAFALGSISNACAIVGFLAVTGVMFAFNLESNEGGDISVAAMWASSVAPLLPVLAALLGMGVWSDERASGRMEVLMSTAVRERELVVGKFFGVLFQLAAVLLLSLGSMFGFLCFFAPSAMAGVSVVGFLPALFGLAMQGSLWCAVTMMASAACSHSSIAAALSIVITTVLPRVAWAGLKSWSSAGRTVFGDMPFDADVFDMATGMIPVGNVALYIVAMLVALFIAVKLVASFRMVGRSAAGLRFSSTVAALLSLAVLALTASVTTKMDAVLDIPVTGMSASLSQRTNDILKESSGNVSVTCFLPRKDARFRSTNHFLRRLKRKADEVGGAHFELMFVDPHWDIGAAERLVKRGVVEDSVVFEKDWRMVAVPFREGCGERACASAIQRLTSGPCRRNIYWTVGHGEGRFDDYGVFGMSDIASDLAHDGYHNRTIDLSLDQSIPGDCALILVAGARHGFSRAELGRLDAYLRDGGRLLVLVGTAQDEGIASILPKWGIKTENRPVSGAPTISGTDVIVSDFAEHPVSGSLRGSRIVIERPVVFVPSATAETVLGADRLDFATIARVGAASVAVAVERGATAGGDVAIRPTRIIAVGDSGFALNGQLASRANANRDFFLNCAAYLSGAEVAGASGNESNLVVTGMDRRTRLIHAAGSSAAFPAAVFVVLMAVALRRRFRT